VGSFITYGSLNIRVNKSRRIRWVGYVAHMRDEKCTENLGWET